MQLMLTNMTPSTNRSDTHYDGSIGRATLNFNHYKPSSNGDAAVQPCYLTAVATCLKSDPPSFAHRGEVLSDPYPRFLPEAEAKVRSL